MILMDGIPESESTLTLVCLPDSFVMYSKVLDYCRSKNQVSMVLGAHSSFLSPIVLEACQGDIPE